LPYTGKGLPTSNLEAIRLLAHSFLFEIDDVLKQRTNNSFTRWMDDIVIGVDDRKEAIDIISSISDMLKSRGLALNLSKTAIYDSEQAYSHFQIEENKYLDTLDGFDKNDSKEFLRYVDSYIVSTSFKSKNPSDFYSVLWFKSKYSHPEELLNFVKKYKNIWLSDSFLRRQVTAVFGRLLIINSKEVDALLYTQISSGINSTVSLANQILQFSNI
jgi:hypothetical protein